MVSKRRRQRPSGRRFIRLWTNVKRSQAYSDLDTYARAAFIELLDHYSGINNGMIVLGVRKCAEALNCSKDKAARALRDLDDSGLAHPTKLGVWRGKQATRWRVTCYRCDLTGDLPVMVWPSRSESATKDCTVRPQGHKS